ncbi:hypothetical protein A2V71_01205 [Candidatus Berkelbacteria bacterium RBG_13_40_8]|uniref:Transglutaminase-like domain-containing protein n=1 Tax=Candidatus Berkelbacteria bacterium RBG_13_40_8 TaxID=1797467 RepID=A0A1F5DQ13_9BACT|nr:MAG: hypothetical protein A2V71_01205 [Candidatus Berkelbacteria bacterium RBG_13_40_8]
MKRNLSNQGQSIIGIIIVLVAVGLISSGFYYYLSKQTQEVNEEAIFSPTITPLPEEVTPTPTPTPTLTPAPTPNPTPTLTPTPTPVVQKCTDGTIYGQCSATKPKYCEKGNLVNKCSICDCHSGQQCQTAENCVVSPCVDNDYYCPWECNNWKLDNDCGVPQIYDFVESRNISDYLGNMIHWDDTAWRNYQPLINKVNEIINGITDDFDKAKAIANWVKHSKIYQLQGTSAANQRGSVIDIFNAQEGVCEDAAILTTAMFRIAGFPARVILPVDAWHAYSEVFIENRWVSFDSVFGSGNVSVADPGTSLIYNNKFYKHEPKFITIFSDGRTYDITNVSYYKVNIIQRAIFKSGEADIKIGWSLDTQQLIKEKYCTLSSFKTSQEEKYGLSPIEKTLTMDGSKYSLNCVVIFESDQHTEHNELITITFTGTKVQTESVISDGYIAIDIETVNIRNTHLEWGTIYIPKTDVTLFKNQDNSYSLIYDKASYSDFTNVKWEIKSNNLNCDWYNCEYTNNNNYSQNIQPTGILGYGDGGMPPDHFNGFVRVKLPEGSYKLIYLIPFYGIVAYKLFQIKPNQEIVIYPDELSKGSTTDINLFSLVQSSLLSSIEGLSP